jgi:hypothetical protein
MQNRITHYTPPIEIDIEQHQVIFVKDPARITIDEAVLPEDTYLIYHDSYTYPKIEGAKPIPFSEFKKIYLSLHANLYILVGLNHIVTPSNRCDFVQEHLSTLTQSMKKISIDTKPFVGEPWRIFFHYLYTNNNKFKRSHSYAMQTEWKHWFYRDTRDCILSSNNIKLYLVNTFSNLEILDTSFEFNPLSEVEEEWYKKQKDIVFEKYHTPKSLIKGLLKRCNKKHNLDIGYDTYLRDELVTLPNYNVYRFMAEENLRRQGIYNAAVEVGKDK